MTFNNIGPAGLLMLIIMVALIVVPYFRIWKRTGHSGWISVLMIVPLVNIVLLYVLAFKRWPSIDGPANVSERFE